MIFCITEVSCAKMYLLWRMFISFLGLLVLVINTSICSGDTQSSTESGQMLQVDLHGGIELRRPYRSDSKHIEINIRSIPTKSLKSLSMEGVKLTWDANTPPILFDQLTSIYWRGCLINPHSMKFSSNLLEMDVLYSTLENGTIIDLLSTANNLRKLTFDNYFRKELINVESLPYNTLEELEVHFAVLGVEFANCWKAGNYSDHNCSRTVYFPNLEKLSLEWVEINPLQVKFGEKLKALKIQYVKFVNEGELRKLVESAKNLEDLTLEDDLVDVSGLDLKILKNLTIRSNEFCYTRDPNLGYAWEHENLKYLDIRYNILVNGTLEDYLKTAEYLEYLTLRIRSIDIGKLPGIKSLRELNINDAEVTCTQNRVVYGTLQPKENCRLSLYFQNMEKLTFHDVEFNPAHIRLGDKLRILKIYNGRDRSQHAWVQLFELADVSDVHLETLTGLSIRMHAYTPPKNSSAKLINGQVEDFLCTLTGLDFLEIDIIQIPPIDISKLSCLKALIELRMVSYNGEINFGANNSVVFQALQTLFISSTSLIPWLVSTDTTHFNTTFPNISSLFLEAVISPSLLLSALKINNLKTLLFAFDTNPQKRSYNFGACVKFINTIKLKGEGEVKYYNLFQCNTKVSKACRIRLVAIQKNILNNGSFNWELLSEKNAGIEIREYDKPRPEKPLGAKITIYIYCAVLIITTTLGFVGNSISAIVLVKSKMWTSSSGIVLLSLTFCDSAIIITYIITLFFSVELFYGFFFKLEEITLKAKVEEYTWVATRNWIQAMTVYPVNKIAYTGSVYLTVLISMERFVAICFPLKSKIILSFKNTRVSVIVVLVFSLILNFPRWLESVEWDFYSEESPHWNEYYKPTLMRMRSYVVMYHHVSWPVLMYIIPFLVIGILNFKIIQQMRISLRGRQSLATRTNAADQMDAEMASLNRMLLCVVGVFVMCNALHIILVFYFFFGYEGIEPSTIEAVAGLPLIINSSVNFIIYVGLGKKFRGEFVKLIPKCVVSCWSWCINAKPKSSPHLTIPALLDSDVGQAVINETQL